MMFTVLVVLCSVYFVASFCASALLRRLDFSVGIGFGVFYFICIPLLCLLYMGEMPLPMDFSRSLLTDVELEVNRHALEIISAFLVALVLFDFLSWGRHLHLSQEDQRVLIPQNQVWSAFWICFSLYISMASFLFVKSGLLDGGHWYYTKKEMMKSQGSLAVLINYLQTSLRLVMGALLISLIIRQRVSIILGTLFLSLICAFDLYVTGNRIFTLQMMLMLLIVLIMNRHYVLLLIGGVLLVPFGYAMSIFRWVRSQMHSGEGEGLSFVIDGLVKGIEYADKLAVNFGVVNFISGVTESVNLNVLVKIIETFPKDYEFLGGQSLVKLFVFWVPRSLWPDKPTSVTSIAGELYAPGSGASFATTIFGEFYMNFGTIAFGVLPVILMIILSISFVKYFRVDHAYAIVFLLSGFTLVRMAFSDIILVMLISLMLMFLVIKSVEFFSSLKSPYDRAYA